ncbi:hypothetical protein WH47_03848 [Habropoda laboriosa]|uniref:Uncharacterized protein n=1 Tax=Habropoda laboriosa TaxID=597456 RepID=A0A0L7QUY5_9HYME|nr:hypothetical protein WH47_03848 [Habropoda laboriosa]
MFYPMERQIWNADDTILCTNRLKRVGWGKNRKIIHSPPSGVRRKRTVREDLENQVTKVWLA